MLSIKVANVIPLKRMELLVFFENGVIKKFDVKPLLSDFPEFTLLRDPAIFQLVQVEPGGYGVSWNDELDCSEGELWKHGIEIPLELDDFSCFVKYGVVNTNEAASIMKCTRQNIESVVKRDRIHPVKKYKRTKLFLRSDFIHMKENHFL